MNLSSGFRVSEGDNSEMIQMAKKVVALDKNGHCEEFYNQRLDSIVMKI